MTKKIILTVALVSCFFIGVAAITGLNGRWAGTVKIADDNELALTYNFKVDGDKLTGTVESPEGNLPLADGVLTGSEFTFKVKVGSMVVYHVGKYCGDSVVVSADVSGNSFHSTLKRTAK